MTGVFASLLLLVASLSSGVHSVVFTIKNNCSYDIWPATLTGSGSPIPTGFQLPPNAIKTLDVSTPWSGRIWARSKCTLTDNRLTCLSGDCQSGQVECNGQGAVPPVTLIEFTLAGYNGLDFYDISLVDGSNLPVLVSPGRTGCPTTDCAAAADINSVCPAELAVKDPIGAVIGCKSACVALNQPQYCCTGAYGSPDKCNSTSYSRMFKSKCPHAYSYAYDDKTSTFTCQTGGDYAVTFCPN